MNLPKKIDWRDNGVVSMVRNQGKCGACWAYSVLETVESMSAIVQNTNQIEELSIQQMLDCAPNSNCSGGNTCTLLEWLHDKNIIIANTTIYPDSENKWSSVCKNISLASGTRIKQFSCLDLSSTENRLVHILATHGPVSAAVNAITWQNYLGGIIQYHCDSSVRNLNHAVQIVGYDLTDYIPYYIVRNSWGTNFGNNGYIKIKIGDNLCGIAHEIAVVDPEIV